MMNLSTLLARILQKPNLTLLHKIYLFFLICGLFAPHKTIAQVITVIDQNTLQPVENAVISNQNHTFSITTDHNGSADTSVLPTSGVIEISHPSYEAYFTSHEAIKSEKFRVALRQKTIHIEEVVISANRWEQDKRQTPNQIVSIGTQEIEFNNPQTTADMLAKTNQVFVQKSQLGGGSPMIRGFSANAVLIVVDGVRMNNAIFRGGNLQNVISIDPLALENTEVLFGPGSVMYGSDALGGVMHFRTKSPGFLTNSKPKIAANSYLRYSSANREKTGHADLSIRGNKVSQFTSFTFSDYQHLRTGNERTSKFPDYGKRLQYVERVNNQDRVMENPNVNEQLFSGYHQWNLLNKLRYRLGSKAEVSYTFNYSTTSDIPRYDRLIETDDSGNFKAGDWFYGPQSWLSNSIQASLYNDTRFFDGARIIVAHQIQKESRNDRNYGEDRLRIQTEKVNVLTVNVDLEKNVDSENVLFFGLEWFYNKVDSEAIARNLISGIETPAIPRYPNGGSNYSGLAAYLSHKWKPSDRLAVTSGLRYNRIWLNARYGVRNSPPLGLNNFSIENGALNGNLGAAWLVDPTLQLNILFSTGFRAPNIDDIGKIFDGSNGVVTVPNPRLAPEYSYNFELGFTKTIEEKLKVSGTAYFIYLDNAIVQTNFTYHGNDSIYYNGELSQVQALVNTNSARIFGGNLLMEYAVSSKFNVISSFTVTRGKDSEDQPLRHTTPNFGHFALRYRHKQFQAELDYRFSGKRDFEDLALSEQLKTHLYTPDGALAWQTLNFSSSYHFSKTLTLTAGIENIFDTHYRPYSSGISAAGRNYIVALKAGF